MKSYVFVTDSDSDLPFDLLDTLDIQMIYMPYSIEGVEYFDDLGRSANQTNYFNNMRNGAVPVTSCLPAAYFEEYFEPFLKEGKDILYIAFSSQLSQNLNNVYASREVLLEKYPERKFEVVDTLSISAPQSILILKAYEMYEAGSDIKTVANWVNDNKLRSHAWLTVDSLVYLKRGGRISNIAAAMGSLLDLKPIIIINREGKMVSISKVQGRKRALHSLVNKSLENIDDFANADITIIHADALNDANYLADCMRKKIPENTPIKIQFVGPVIGAHCGPGTVAICFFGKERSI